MDVSTDCEIEVDAEDDAETETDCELDTEAEGFGGCSGTPTVAAKELALAVIAVGI